MKWTNLVCIGLDSVAIRIEPNVAPYRVGVGAVQFAPMFLRCYRNVTLDRNSGSQRLFHQIKERAPVSARVLAVLLPLQQLWVVTTPTFLLVHVHGSVTVAVTVVVRSANTVVVTCGDDLSRATICK